jgi:hypothetical protein
MNWNFKVNMKVVDHESRFPRVQELTSLYEYISRYGQRAIHILLTKIKRMKNSVVTKIDQDSKGLYKTNEQNDFDYVDE